MSCIVPVKIGFVKVKNEQDHLSRSELLVLNPLNTGTMSLVKCSQGVLNCAINKYVHVVAVGYGFADVLLLNIYGIVDSLRGDHTPIGIQAPHRVSIGVVKTFPTVVMK
jgi:hypothetical protein